MVICWSLVERTPQSSVLSRHSLNGMAGSKCTASVSEPAIINISEIRHSPKGMAGSSRQWGKCTTTEPAMYWQMGPSTTMSHLAVDNERLAVEKK